MLDNVKQTNRRESLRQYSSVFQCRPHHLPYTAFDGITDARKSRFHEDHLKAGLLNGTRDVTIPATDIKEGSLRREEIDRFQNAAIPVLKPKRRFLNPEA
jgi:hypothetical protein